MYKFRVLDLFSGIGGFSLGLEKTGCFETVSFCEIDPFCRYVLKKHWPSVPILNDIRGVDCSELGRIDVITGGYPCQPFSVAGKQKGHEDDRHLWPEMFEVIAQCRPSWVICENVYGHVKLGLDEVLSDLESEGYATSTFVIPACAVDAPHRRDRLWIVANSSSKGRQQEPRGSYGDEKENEGRRAKDHHESSSNGKSDRSGFIPGLVADSKSKNARSSHTEPDKRQKQKSRKSSGPDWQPWPVEPGLGRVANGIPRRVDRLRALGNSVVPEIPYRIGISIIKEEARRAHGQGTHDDTRKS